MIYHVLPEVEPFSESAGGSLSRWAANMLRADDAQIVCPGADASWGFSRERVHSSRSMRMYGRLLRSREMKLRVSARVPLARVFMRGILSRLTAGDVLYIHNRPEYVLALPRAGRRRGVKVVLHMHNDHLAHLGPSQKERLDPDVMIFNSYFLAERGRRIVPGLDRLAVLYNGADESCFYPDYSSADDDVPTILFVGRLVPEKGVHVLVDAMRRLQADGVAARAKIIGSTHFGDPHLSGYAEALRRSAPENVEFVPYRTGKALASDFRQASIFCCPSNWEEPFGMVNVEAMASGLPVVATRSGGIPEIFSEGGGVLVEKGSVDELTAALKRLALSRSERRALGKQGLANYRKRFRWEVIAQEYRSLMRMINEMPQPFEPGHAAPRRLPVHVRTVTEGAY